MKKVILALAALALVSCSTYDAVRMLSNASHPSSDSQPAAQATPADQTAAQPGPAGLDAAAKADWARYSQPAPSGKTFGASGDPAAPATLQPGAWAVYRSLENGQVKGIIKLALVGKQGDAWIYEFVSYSEKDSAVVQQAIQGLDEMVQTGNSDKGKVLWMKVKGKDGKIQTIDGAMLAMAGGSYKGMVTANALPPSTTVTAGGPITVPAGTFTSTWKADSQVSQGRNSEPGTSWVSTQVPLWHLIKGQTKKGNVLELVDFGTSGYQSSMN